MPSVKNFSAWVETDDGVLEEFSVEYLPNKNKAICWVPSEEGKTFRVGFKKSMFEYPIKAACRIDGTQGSSTKIIESCTLDDATGSICGVRTSRESRQLFQFARYQLLEEEECVNASLNPCTGEIEVTITQVEMGPLVPRGPYTPVALPLLEVSEKAKKGLVHGVQLSQDVPARRTSDLGRRAKLVKKLATFIFKYRPIDVLRADGNAPAAPAQSTSSRVVKKKASTPSQLQAKLSHEDVIDLTLDDDDDDEADPVVVTRLQALEAEVAVLRGQLKGKRKRSSNDEGVSVKKEVKLE